MDAAALERLEDWRRSVYPRRFVAVYRDRGFYVIHNLLNDAKRFYADARDVAACLNRADSVRS